jgi:hypothetical protein
VRVLEFNGQDGGSDPQQLAAVIEVELRRDLSEQPVAFHSQGTGCRIEFGQLEIIDDVLQQAYLIAGEEGKQVFSANGEASKDHLAAIGSTELAAGSTVQHENISVRKPLVERSAEASSDTSFGEHESKSILLVDPFCRRFEAQQPQSQVILSKHSAPP